MLSQEPSELWSYYPQALSAERFLPPLCLIYFLPIPGPTLPTPAQTARYALLSLHTSPHGNYCSIYPPDSPLVTRRYLATHWTYVGERWRPQLHLPLIIQRAETDHPSHHHRPRGHWTLALPVPIRPACDCGCPCAHVPGGPHWSVIISYPYKYSREDAEHLYPADHSCCTEAPRHLRVEKSCSNSSRSPEFLLFGLRPYPLCSSFPLFCIPQFRATSTYNSGCLMPPL
jgi:hypothetical protein